MKTIANWPSRLVLKGGRVVHAARAAAEPVVIEAVEQLAMELRCEAGKRSQKLGVEADGDHFLDPATAVTCIACVRSDAS